MTDVPMTQTTEPILRLENVKKSFGDLVAVDTFSIDVAPGEFLTLLGPSGCGKTTILRLIAGFESPDQGDIYINGVRVNGIPANRRDVNTVFQSYGLFPHMTVFENIAFGPRIKKLGKKRIAEKVNAALEMVRLRGMGERRIHQLSGGQQQRVAVARAIVNEPVVLLLDEPLSALDYRLRKEMQLELKRLQRRLGITFIFVTHDQEEAIIMSDRIMVMNKGVVEQVGTPKEIYEAPDNLFVARFVGEINVFDGTILSAQNGRLRAAVEQGEFPLESERPFKAKDAVKVLLRPEDIKVERLADGCDEPYLTGRIEEMIYKGTTVDLMIRLDSGKKILATRFFNEEAEDIHYEPGETVCVSWFKGWEVVLPDG